MNDFHAFLEFSARKVIRLIVPVVGTMVVDAILTRVIENQEGPGTVSKSVVNTMGRNERGASMTEALAMAISFMLSIVIGTGLILVLYFAKLTKVILGWLVVGISIILSYSFRDVFLKIPRAMNFPVVVISMRILIFNLVVVGNFAIFGKGPRCVTQFFLVLISVLASLVFLEMPDWTIWFMLVILIVYDALVVLCPHGLLKMLIDETQQRGDPLPALVYSTAAFETSSDENDDDRSIQPQALNDNDDAVLTDSDLPHEYPMGDSMPDDGIKLGLGDFVFYGTLITRAARIGWDFVIICVMGIMLGLCLTLICLLVFQRPLPALPFSLTIGILYFAIGVVSFRDYLMCLRERLFLF